MSKLNYITFTIVTLVVMVLSADLYADLGLSFQVMGGYVLDGNASEKGIKDAAQASLDNIRTLPVPIKNDDTLKLVNCALFVEYNFWRTFFIRSGIDYARNIDDLESSFVQTGEITHYTVKHSYEYIGIPLLLGISIPINRKEYNVYMGLGPCYNMVVITREGEGYEELYPTDLSEEHEYNAYGLGFMAIAGINARVYSRVSLSIELAFYDFSKEKEEKIEVKRIAAGDLMYDIKQKYVFAAPKTSIRLGVRYSI